MPGSDADRVRRQLERWLQQQRREGARGSLRRMPPGTTVAGAAGLAGAREALRGAAEEEARRAAAEAVDRTPGSGRPGRLRESLHQRGHAIDVSRNLFDAIVPSSEGDDEVTYRFLPNTSGQPMTVRLLDTEGVVQTSADIPPGTAVIMNADGTVRPVQPGEQAHANFVGVDPGGEPGQALVQAHFTVERDGRVVQHLRQYAPPGQVNWDRPSAQPERWQQEDLDAIRARIDGQIRTWEQERLSQWEPATGEEIMDSIRQVQEADRVLGLGRRVGRHAAVCDGVECRLCNHVSLSQDQAEQTYQAVYDQVAGEFPEERADLERSGHTVPRPEEDPMPATMTTETIEAATWSDLTAEQIEALAAWLPGAVERSTGAFLPSVERQFNRNRRLSDRQLAAILTQYNREASRAQDSDTPSAANNGTTPAETNDAPQILNGTYTVSGEGEHLTYQIYTVQQGQLQGKRIIKIQRTYGSFHGFAFLTTSGGVKVWRRFAADDTANERYITWARLLLDGLNDRSAEVRTGTTEFYHNDYQIQVSTVCRRCNRRLTTPTSVERGIGPECEGREAGVDRTVRASETARGVDPEYQEQQRVQAANRRAARVAARNATIGAQINAVVGRSEVNPEEVQ